MPDATDILRATEGLRQTQEQATDSLAAGAKGVAQGVHGFADFFKHVDNLFALVICFVALVGLYRLLKAERIIPSYRRPGGGLLSSALAQRLAVKLILGVVVAAVVLTLLALRLTNLLPLLRSLF